MFSQCYDQKGYFSSASQENICRVYKAPRIILVAGKGTVVVHTGLQHVKLSKGNCRIFLYHVNK